MPQKQRKKSKTQWQSLLKQSPYAALIVFLASVAMSYITWNDVPYKQVPDGLLALVGYFMTVLWWHVFPRYCQQKINEIDNEHP